MRIDTVKRAMQNTVNTQSNSLMLNQKFETMHCGEVMVCDYQSAKEITVIFTATGTKIKTTKRVLTGSDKPRLRDPLAKSVFGIGCIGVGPYKAHQGPADTREFGVWRAMLRRCYYRRSKHHQRSYEGCVVADEWHNFQVFAKWFRENYPDDGGRYQLDKDTLFPGNKVYSPERCRFVTQAENLSARRMRK